jgi:hypothetical protein
MSRNVPFRPRVSATWAGRCATWAAGAGLGRTFGKNEPKRTQRKRAENLRRELETRFARMIVGDETNPLKIDVAA